jgi:hypothetical protein
MVFIIKLNAYEAQRFDSEAIEWLTSRLVRTGFYTLVDSKGDAAKWRKKYIGAANKAPYLYRFKK